MTEVPFQVVLEWRAFTEPPSDSHPYCAHELTELLIGVIVDVLWENPYQMNVVVPLIGELYLRALLDEGFELCYYVYGSFIIHGVLVFLMRYPLFRLSERTVARL